MKTTEKKKCKLISLINIKKRYKLQIILLSEAKAAVTYFAESLSIRVCGLHVSHTKQSSRRSSLRNHSSRQSLPHERVEWYLLVGDVKPRDRRD